eukprot:980934-Prymnesium_polylepis.1
MWRANSHLLPALGHGTGRGHARRSAQQAKRTRARPPGVVSQRHSNSLINSNEGRLLEHGNEALSV